MKAGGTRILWFWWLTSLLLAAPAGRDAGTHAVFPQAKPEQVGVSAVNLLKPFLRPICESVSRGAPYPPSPVIAALASAKTMPGRATSSCMPTRMMTRGPTRPPTASS